MAVEPILHFPQSVGAAAIADLHRVFDLQRERSPRSPTRTMRPGWSG